MHRYDRLYIDKPTRTFADELVAFGMIRLAEDIYSSTPHTIVLRDCGSYTEITLDPPITPDMFAQVGLMAPVPFIKTLKNTDSLPSDAPSVDYEYWKDIRKQYFAAQDRDSLIPPHEHWDIFRAVNPAALPGYTSVLGNWWRVQPQLPDVLTLIFDLYSQYPNDLEGAVTLWKDMDKHYGWDIKPDSTCQQLFNPDQGKGQNRVKADGLSVGNMDNFWLVEFLKMVGFYEAAMTRTVKGGKDRKTFVVAPRKLDYAKHTDLMSRFRASMRAAENSIRFDILASLRYTRTLIEYYLEPEAPTEPWLQGIYYPAQEVSGFRTAFYKDLGNAVATMNLAFVALPGWVKIDSHDDAAEYVRLLAEQPSPRQFSFIQFVRQFEEKNSDAYRLLQYLRDFVSGGDRASNDLKFNLKAFFRFTAAFAGYYMGMKERNKYVVALTPAFIDRIMLAMSEEMKLYEIIINEGFQNVAYAIRQSTVVAQYRKKQGDRKYDVRYGLGQELHRKARYPNDFMIGLSEFASKYNAENAQVMETRPGPYRRSLQTSDLEAIAYLIDECGSELIGNMLVAYGYARSPRKDEDPALQDEQSEEETDD